MCVTVYVCVFTATASISVLGYFGEPGVGVLTVCTQDTPTPLVLTYNSTTQRHSIGVLHQVTEEVSQLTHRW